MSKSKIRATDDLRTRFRPTCDDITLERGLETHSLGVSRNGDDLVNVPRNPAFKRDKGAVARPYLNTSARKSRRPECGGPTLPPDLAFNMQVTYEYVSSSGNNPWLQNTVTLQVNSDNMGTNTELIMISTGSSPFANNNMELRGVPPNNEIIVTDEVGDTRPILQQPFVTTGSVQGQPYPGVHYPGHQIHQKWRPSTADPKCRIYEDNLQGGGPYFLSVLLPVPLFKFDANGNIVFA